MVCSHSNVAGKDLNVLQVAERAVQQLRTPLVASSEVGSLPSAGTDLVEPAATGLTPVSTTSGIGTIPESEPSRSPKDGLLLGSSKPPVSDGQIPGRPAGLRVEVSRRSAKPPRVRLHLDHAVSTVSCLLQPMKLLD